MKRRMLAVVVFLGIVTNVAPAASAETPDRHQPSSRDSSATLKIGFDATIGTSARHNRMRSDDARKILFHKELLSLEADADDVDGVRFLVDGRPVGDSPGLGVGTEWDTRSVPDGSYVLTAVAVDRKGQVVATASESVAVANHLLATARLRQDYRARLLSADDYVTFGLWSLTNPALLPERYAVPVRGGELTRQAMTYLRAWRKVSPERQRELEEYFRPQATLPRDRRMVASTADDCRPRDTSYMGDTYTWVYDGYDRYQILFNRSGDHSVNTDAETWHETGRIDGSNNCPDFVEKVAYSLDNAWDVYALDLNYAMPTGPVTVVVNQPLCHASDCGGMALEFQPLLESTIQMSPTAGNPFHLAAHELFHLVQYQYKPLGQLLFQGDFTRDFWWLEASAEWAAHKVEPANALRDELVYAGNLGAFLGTPSKALMSLADEGRDYGGFIFAEFLEESVGVTAQRPNADVIRRIWAAMGQSNGFPGADQAMEEVIASYGQGLPAVLMDFWQAAYRLGPVAWSDPHAGAWRDLLQGTTGSPHPTSHGGTLAVGQTMGSGGGSVTVHPGGATFLKLEPALMERGILRITVAPTDGMLFETVQFRGMPFTAYPLTCAESWNPSIGATSATFEVELGYECNSFVLAIIHTDADLGAQARSFSWSATLRHGYYHEQTLDGRPVGYWKLDERSGAVADDASPSGLDGQYVGGVGLAKRGAVKGGATAVRFDGHSSHVAVPYDERLFQQHLTVEAWIRTDLNDSVHERWALFRGGAFAVGTYRGRIRAYLTIDGAEGTKYPLLADDRLIHDGAWHHVAVTYDGAIAKLYVDGDVGATHSYAGRIGVGGGNGIRIGGGTNSPYDYFPGDVDEVAVYDHALSADSISARLPHRWTPTPKCSGTTSYTSTICADNPIGFWRLNEAVGPAAEDFTTLSNGAASGSVIFGKQGAVGGDGNFAVQTSETASVWVPYETYGTYVTKKLTAEAWIRTSLNDGVHERWAVRREGAFAFGTYQGKVRAYLTLETSSGNQWPLLTNSRLINDGAWHHVALTYDGTTGKLFVDGEAQAHGTVNVTGRIGQGIGKGIRIGGGTNSPYDYFPGDVDEVAVYDHAVPAANMPPRWAHRR